MLRLRARVVLGAMLISTLTACPGNIGEADGGGGNMRLQPFDGGVLLPDGGCGARAGGPGAPSPQPSAAAWPLNGAIEART
jgi:hypothetical protein